jgi:hypothetical protein
MIDYTLTEKQDKYYVINNELSSMTYTLVKVDECTASRDSVASGTIAPSEEAVIPISLDGTYEVILQVTAEPDLTIYIVYYVNFQLSLIEDVYNSICSCECGCKDCTDVTGDCKILLITSNKIDVFKYLVDPRYKASFEAVHQGTACLIEPAMYCDIATEIVTGSSQYNENLTKKLIALDYLAMYFTDLSGLFVTEDQEEIDYVNTKYQSKAILCCISSLGIDINKIKTIIDDMGTITINSGSYVNLPPTTGDNTLATANRTDYVFTMADFTANTTPAYSDPEGTPAIAVRFTSLPADGTIKLNSNPVNINDVIDKASIDANQLTYTPPDQDPVDADSWTFQAQDTDGLWSS